MEAGSQTTRIALVLNTMRTREQTKKLWGQQAGGGGGIKMAATKAGADDLNRTGQVTMVGPFEKQGNRFTGVDNLNWDVL